MRVNKLWQYLYLMKCHFKDQKGENKLKCFWFLPWYLWNGKVNILILVLFIRQTSQHVPLKCMWNFLTRWNRCFCHVMWERYVGVGFNNVIASTLSMCLEYLKQIYLKNCICLSYKLLNFPPPWGHCFLKNVWQPLRFIINNFF